MLSRRNMLIASSLSKTREELAFGNMTEEVTYDGMTSTVGVSVVKSKPVELGKQYLLVYEYYIELLDIQLEGTARHDFSLRYTGAFGYTYSIRIHANHGVWPSPIVSQGRFEGVLTCTLAQSVVSDLLRVSIIAGKAKVRVWNVSLTEV